MKELTLYIIYAIKDGETVDCNYTTNPLNAEEYKTQLQNDGYDIKSEEHHFTQDEIDSLLYESIYGECQF